MAGDRMKAFKPVMLVICMAVVLVWFSGCSMNKRKTAATESPVSSPASEESVSFVGVIKSVDTLNQRIVFYNTMLDADESYGYSGATLVYSKNDRDMSMEEMAAGDVCDVYTSGDGRKIIKIKESADIIEVENTRVLVDANKKRMTVQGVTYGYSEQIAVFSEGRQIQPMELTENDEVTFRGVKGQAYSLVVTKGHGYIRPTGYKDFIGGTLTVQGEAILPVSNGMLLTVPEGTQTLMMENGDLTSTAAVEVERNQVTNVNMSKYQSQLPDTARVKFIIEPNGAELYINGSLMDYSKTVSMKYGKHSLKVILEGYNDYNGIIDIKDAAPIIRIDLAEETAEVDSEDDSDSSVSSDDSSSKPSSADYDTDHKITISAPSGAAVYVNGTYKGQIPCSFTKMLGNVTVTLTKENCETKSYSIEIPDDSQDISWSFPDLKTKGSG
ncbi:MAG: PEGA domain-containing protein [Lachnospiraceae bacterium]|nr:PEGA domain-containing protein [Lachnospiraceae bacterium]